MKKSNSRLIKSICCAVLINLGFFLKEQRMIFYALSLIPSTMLLIDMIKDWKEEKREKRK